MPLRFGATARLLVLALLLLVVSPVTAPFSTCDPLDLFGGTAAPASSSGVHKLAQDPQAIACASPVAGLPTIPSTPAAAVLPSGATHVHCAPCVPLRI